MLNVIDYQNFLPGLNGFYFQPQLLLNSVDDGKIQEIRLDQRFR